MTNFTKSVKLRLREPNKKKQEKIDQAIEESRKVANAAANRMPSIPNKYVKSPKGKGSPLYGIVQDLRQNGVSLNAACAFEAVGKARESYLSQCVNGSFDSPPKFEEGFVRLHNRYNIDRFFEKDGTFYVTLKLYPYEKATVPFYPGDYQEYFLDRIVNGELDYGSGDITKYDYGYSLNLSIKKEVDLDYVPETLIGVDLGLNVIAWAVALDREGNFLDETHFDGSEAGHIRRRYKKLRDELDKSGEEEKREELGDREHRWMENKNHIISRRIIEFAEQFEKLIILLENINMDQLRKRTDSPKIHKWTAGKLRDFITYKAKEAGIKTELIDPKNTSRECPKCSHVSKNNRDGIEFSCEECGYENHSDFIGASNIARKPLTS